MHSWAPGDRPLRLVERAQEKGDDEPKALSCYGVLLEEDDQQEMLLRFVKERPVSGVTTIFLEWVCEPLEERGKQVWALVWDNASWHVSGEVRGWIREHNAEARSIGGGVRIITCELPSRSPWPWSDRAEVAAWQTRAIVEPNGTLTIAKVMERLCAHYDCEQLAPIAKNTS